MAKSDVSNVKRNYGLWVRSNGQLWLSYINTGGAERLLASAAGTITIGTFQHVAGVIDTVSGTMRVFKNGVEMGSAPASGAMAVNTEPLTIGFADPGIGNDFNGLIDEVEIFNRALSEAEIRSIFDSGREGKIKPPPGPLEPPAGMVSWWPGDGNALDIEDGNDGALSGDATFTGGMVGQAFRFDGTGDFVEIPDSANLDITESITVDAWINQRSRSPEVAPIVSKWNDIGVNNRSYHLVLQGSSLRWDVSRSGLFGPSQSATVFSSVGVPLHMWVHVAGTFDSMTQVLRIYVNGVEVGSAVAPSSNIFPSNEPLLIGAGDIGSNVRDFFDGLIDEVELFDRALTEAEIWAIFNAGPAGKRKPQAIEPPAGMVSWWPGDGDTRDIIGDNDGTLSGDAIFAPGKVGQAFSFDGTGDFVLVPDSPNLNITGNVTVDLWAKRNGTGTGYLISKGAGAIQGVDVPTAYAILFLVDNRVRALFERADGSNLELTGPALADAAFHHYAYVRGGNTHELFIDGVLVTSGTFTGIPGDTSGLPLVIGALRSDSEPTGFFGHFAGIIDEVEVFDRALTEAEIRAIFQAGREGKIKPQPVEPPAGMVSWWPGDGNAKDIVNGNHGTLVGNATATGVGVVAQAFSFDGVEDFVEVPHDASLNLPQFSVDAWVFIDPALNAGQVNVFVGKSDGSSATGGFFLLHDDRKTAQLSPLARTTNALRFEVLRESDVISGTFLTDAFPKPGFYHVAATFDGVAAKLDSLVKNLCRSN